MHDPPDVPAIRIDVVLPVLDEAAALPSVLAGLPEGYRAIVVDNGSTDGSGGLAAELGAVVVRERERGFGAACATGLAHATAPVVAFCDADGSLDLADLHLVCDPVLVGDADLVLGARIPERGAWPAHARVANRYLAWRVGRGTLTRLHDLGPMRAAHRDAWRALEVRDRRFGWPLEQVLRAVHAGWRIEEVPVAYHPRIGRSKVTGTVCGTGRVLRDMSRVLADLG